VDRGHLRRANRSEIALGALFTRIRRARAEAREDPRLAARLRQAMARFDEAKLADALPVTTAIGRAGRIAIVTFELLVPDKSGGIGTWAANLAMSLRAAGHAVTIYCAKRSHGDSWPLKYWEANGIELVRLSLDDRRPFAEDVLQNLAHVALEALVARTWDIIHVPDALALGWQVIAAKRLGLAFKGATIAVTLHGNNWWHRTANRLPVLAQDVELDHFETEQMRGADVVVAPSRYMLDHVERAYPGALARGYVSQNPIPWPCMVRRHETGRRPINELVFFGRLEPRKGLWTFCDALDRLVAERDPEFSVTFLGAFGTAEIRSELMERIRDWPRVKVIEGFLVNECRLYLSEAGRLAVMPSHGDNSPYTILECLAAGIPFLATYVGGVPELIHVEDREQVLVPDNQVALATALRRVLAEGALVARAAIPSYLSELRLLLWHERVLAANRNAPRDPEAVALPAMSICVSPRAPDRRDFSMDWLRNPGTTVELMVGKAQLSKEVALFVQEYRDQAHGLAVTACEIDRGDLTPQAHLNRLASSAAHEVLVLSDPAIQPDSGSVQTLVRGLAETGAAAIVVQARLVLEQGGNPIKAHPSFRIVPQATPSLARLKNVFGAPLFAVRKDVFMRLGGLDTQPAFSRAWHWEFLTRLLEMGERVAVSPFCFGSWRIDVSTIDEAWPWGPVSLLDQIDGGRPSVARQQLQMLRDHLERAAPTFDRVRRLVRERKAPSGKGRRSLLLLEGAELAILRGSKNTKLLATASGLEIDCRDEDPIVRLPPIASAGGARDLVVEIALRVPNEGNLKVYWRNGKSGDGFSEDRSVARYLMSGDNAVTMRIAKPYFPVSLRLDPGESPGRYLLRSVAVFGE
jgi:glycosyltransferase involved in cell wall biosynthesis